jgi:alginate biosynthesis protein Alg44
MTNNPNLVHEADAQRHHVRVKIPSIIEINGAHYITRDWSTAGASVTLDSKSDRADFSIGKSHTAKMIFEFEGFSLSVPLKMEVRSTAEGEGQGSIGLRFIEMTQDQIVIMQHLVGSYVSGELTSVNEIIHVLSRNNFTKPRQIPKREEALTARERIFSIIGKSFVPLASLVLIAYVGMAVFEQKFVINAAKAVVTADNVILAAPVGGVAGFKDIHAGDIVKKGDVIATVLSETGAISSLDSPCDCVIEDRIIEPGNVVSRGTALMRLIPLDSPLRVEAFVNYEDAIRLAKGQTTWMNIAGSGRQLSGVITGVSMSAGGGDRAKLFIKPDEKIESILAGTPVSVKINTARRIKVQE